MKISWIAAALIASGAHGQVDVRMRLAYSTVLHMEPILATVTIVNSTESDLVVGETTGNSRLFFDIETGPGRPFIPRTDAVMFRTPASVPAMKSATLEFNLLPLYSIRSPGAFSVTARLQGPGGLVTSGRQFLDVVPGMVIASVSRPVQDLGQLRYQLRTLARDRADHLFLRIDDAADEICYGVYKLGTVIRVVDPVMRFDRFGMAHILHQSSPTRFTHSSFEPDGTPYRSRFWTGKASSVGLQLTEDGEIEVVGAQPYRGDVGVAPSRADARRIDEMMDRRGLPSRYSPVTPDPAPRRSSDGGSPRSPPIPPSPGSR